MLLTVFGVLFGAAAFFGGIAWLVAQVRAAEEAERRAKEKARRLRSVQAVLDRRETDDRQVAP